jgi:glycerol-3-phosphate acyltransferase PlsY
MLPISVLWIWNEDEILYRVFALLVAGMVIVTHQKNISRLIKGVENRISFTSKKRRKDDNG